MNDLLYVVSINLDETDNAQVIFETLNARGTPLSALDLAKNALFLQAERQELNVEELHDEHWEPCFEADGNLEYWNKKTRQGREERPRADWFLYHWLAMQTGRVVGTSNLFDVFRRTMLRDPSAMPTQDLVPMLATDAGILRRFKPAEHNELETADSLFFYRMHALDTTTLFPMALLLYRSPEVSATSRRTALAALESWIVRRALMRGTSANYNRFLGALLRIVKTDLPHAAEGIVRELRKREVKTAEWPTDEQVRNRLEHSGIYGSLGTPRLRMVLEACELRMRDTKTENIRIPRGLSIEHAMPQAWDAHWPLPEGPDPEAAHERRHSRINRLGNLTLVTGELNSSMRNSAWNNPEADPTNADLSKRTYEKRTELRKRSLLLLNQKLVDHSSWNEEAIDRRTHELTTAILEIWPGPDSQKWPNLPSNS